LSESGNEVPLRILHRDRDLDEVYVHNDLSKRAGAFFSRNSLYVVLGLARRQLRRGRCLLLRWSW
jgi:hypothetical protein